MKFLFSSLWNDSFAIRCRSGHISAMLMSSTDIRPVDVRWGWWMELSKCWNSTRFAQCGRCEMLQKDEPNTKRRKLNESTRHKRVQHLFICFYRWTLVLLVRLRNAYAWALQLTSVCWFDRKSEIENNVEFSGQNVPKQLSLFERLTIVGVQLLLYIFVCSTWCCGWRMLFLEKWNGIVPIRTTLQCTRSKLHGKHTT